MSDPIGIAVQHFPLLCYPGEPARVMPRLRIAGMHGLGNSFSVGRDKPGVLESLAASLFLAAHGDSPASVEATTTPPT